MNSLKELAVSDLPPPPPPKKKKKKKKKNCMNFL